MTTQLYTTSTNWTDNDFTIGNPRFTNDKVEYWITAKLSSTQQSLEGNHVEKYGTSWIQWKISSQEVENELDYNLSQNYPNPFNPSTKISWQSPVGSWQTLKVYDVLGNEVTTLVNEWKEAGSYEVTFESNIGIRRLVNGAYIYRLQAGNFVKTKKMLLLE